MSSGAQSPLYTIVSLFLIVSGLVIVGLVSGLIPGLIPARLAAGESAMPPEAQTEIVRAADAVVGNPAGMAIASSATADQPGKSDAALPASVAEAKPKNP